MGVALKLKVRNRACHIGGAAEDVLWVKGVKGELGLWEQEIPVIPWESGGEASQDG